MTAVINTEVSRGFLEIELNGDGVAAGASMGSVLNPEGVDVIILRGFLYATAPATLAATLDIGVGTLAVDSSDIMSALPINGAIAKTGWNGVASLASEAAMTTPAIWTAEKYLNFWNLAQVSTGFRGKFFVEYVRVEDEGD